MKHDEELYIAQSIMSGISALSCCLVILLYIWAKELRIFAFKLVFWLNFNNLIKALFMIVPSSVNKEICIASAYFLYSASLASLIWNIIIAFKLYQSVILEKIELENGFGKLLLASFLVPYTCCLIPLFFDAYGENRLNCLLKSNFYGDIFRFSLYYIPALITMIVSIYSYTKIMILMKANGDSVDGNTKRLKYFPLILIFTVIPQFIARILQSCSIENFYLVLVSSCIWDLSGLFDSLAYVFTYPVILFIKVKIFKLKDINESDTSLISIK